MILKAASGVIRTTTPVTTKPRTSGTTGSAQLHVATNERDEARWIAKQIQSLRSTYEMGEIAIFYRTNSLSRVVEDALRSAALPYAVYGGLKFYERAEIKDVLAYMKLLVNPDDLVALSRAINRPARGIGPGTLEKVLLAAEAEGINGLEAARKLAEEGTKAVRNRLTPFCQMMEELEAVAAQEDAVAATTAILERSGYWTMLREENSVEADARMENLHEFLASIEEFQEKTPEEQHTLAAFLDQIALASDLDDLGEEAGTISMMTVHAAKGLEFDCVFVVGMEEDLLPHFNSQDSPSQLEEERRLCYVAFTRARHRLFLSRTRLRRRFGGVTENSPSRFLMEIPDECVEIDDPALRRFASLRREGFSGSPGAAFRTRQREAAQQEPTFYEEDLGGGASFVPDMDASDGNPGPGSPVFHRKFGRDTAHPGPSPEVRS